MVYFKYFETEEELVNYVNSTGAKIVSIIRNNPCGVKPYGNLTLFYKLN